MSGQQRIKDKKFLTIREKKQLGLAEIIYNHSKRIAWNLSLKQKEVHDPQPGPKKWTRVFHVKVFVGEDGRCRARAEFLRLWQPSQEAPLNKRPRWDHAGQVRLQRNGPLKLWEPSGKGAPVHTHTLFHSLIVTHSLTLTHASSEPLGRRWFGTVSGHLPAQWKPPEELDEDPTLSAQNSIGPLTWPWPLAPEEMEGAAAAAAAAVVSDKVSQRRWLLRPAALIYRRRHVGRWGHPGRASVTASVGAGLGRREAPEGGGGSLLLSGSRDHRGPEVSLRRRDPEETSLSPLLPGVAQIYDSGVTEVFDDWRKRGGILRNQILWGGVPSWLKS